MDTLQQTILHHLLEEAAFDGWTESALQKAAEASGKPKEYGLIAFPGGIAEAADAYIRQADKQMLERLAGQNLSAMKIRERIAAAVWTRLEIYGEHKEAVAGLVSYFTLPTNAPRATKHLAETCNAMWNAAGDNATDYNWYTKRFLLAGVYSSTLLYWLQDSSEGGADTHAFLSRRIDDVMQIQSIKFKLLNMLDTIQKRTG